MEGKGSTLVHLLVIVLSLTAFGLAIAAEQRRSIGRLRRERFTGRTYCIYQSDVATGYGVGAILFLLASQSLVMGVTKCMCFGRPLTPGSNRAWTIIYFTSSWVAFIVAEACLIAGARKNGYHTIYRGFLIFAEDMGCDTLRKGTFIAGAVFVSATTIFNTYYYVHFTQAATPAKRFNFPSGTIGAVSGNA